MPASSRRVDVVGVEEVVLDVAVGEDRQRQRRVRAAHRGPVVVGVASPSRPSRRSGHQPLDGVAQLVRAEQLVLDDPAGQHAVADLVAQVRIVLTEQVEQGRAAARAAVCPGGTSASAVDDRFPQRRSVVMLIGDPVWHPSGPPGSPAGDCVVPLGGPRGAIPPCDWHTCSMRRRPQLIPWKVAGRVTERQASADEVVQATGWVFNNETGDTLTLAEFVATGDNEVAVYLDRFGLLGDDDEDRARSSRSAAASGA